MWLRVQARHRKQDHDFTHQSHNSIKIQPTGVH
jgi:hypothetical protein